MLFLGCALQSSFFHFVITMSALSMNISFFVFIYLFSFFCFSFCAPVLVDNVGFYVRNGCVFFLGRARGMRQMLIITCIDNGGH